MFPSLIHLFHNPVYCVNLCLTAYISNLLYLDYTILDLAGEYQSNCYILCAKHTLLLCFQFLNKCLDSGLRHCWTGWFGSGGDATGSCVDGETLTQAAAPYIPSALGCSNRISQPWPWKLMLFNQPMNQQLTQLNRAPLPTPLLHHLL